MRTNHLNYSKNLGLYIHVPFCASKCSYCDFYSLSGKNILMDSYVKSMLVHIKEYGSVLQNYTIDTVYIGGGTPTYIGAKNLVKLLTAIKKNFTLSKNTEITVEANPESCDKNLFKSLKKAGVNRLSFGFQSTNDDELMRLGRAHTASQAKEMYLLARECGIDNISIDLMYGLPDQDISLVLQSLEDIVNLKPDHISCYGLKLEDGTKLFLENPPLPDDDLQADMYLKICEVLKENGYDHYEISNFSKNSRQSRHNSKYWDLSEYLGLGPGAHSYLNGRRFEFIKDLGSYINGVCKNGDSIVIDEESVPFIHRHGEYIMLRLRTSSGINEEEFLRLFKMPFDKYAKQLEKFVSNGLVEYNSGIWRLTEQGFLLSNSIILSVIDAE